MSNIARLQGDSGEEDDDDENNTEDDKGNDASDGNDDDDGNDGNGDDDDDDANDDDVQEDDGTNDNDKETDNDRTESNIIKIPVLNRSSAEYYEEEEDMIDDEEMMDEEKDDEVTKKMYNDSGFEQVEEDVHVTLTLVSVSYNFISKLLNLENPSLADNEIASLMDTTVRHKEPRVINLEKDPSEIKQVDQYSQALSFIPAIVDRYIDNTLGEAIHKAILAHNLDYREEAQAENRDYIELIDTSIRVILKEEINTQPP
ncbi:hypothetical protein Tco_0016572 [Tanacetum coccineum]